MSAGSAGYQRIHVTLTGKQVTDRWLEALKKCNNLTQLVINRTKVTDAGLEFVAQMTQLQLLSLRYNSITDISVDYLLKLRGNGAELTLGLQIYGTQLSREGIERLKESLEGVKVDYRRGAFLGISGDRFNNLNCSVASVEANQAAARAGIQREDVILSYDGNPVTDFESLTALIAENAPGDRVRMRIQRGDTELEIEVQLGEWP